MLQLNVVAPVPVNVAVLPEHMVGELALNANVELIETNAVVDAVQTEDK